MTDAASGMDGRAPRFRRTDSISIRRTAWASLALVLLGLLVIPLDGPASRWGKGLHLGGDLRRELETLQQYGQGGSIVLMVVLVWLLDPRRRRRLLDWGAAAILVWAVVFGLKVLVGRPRPRMGDPGGFLWPWGTWDYDGAIGPRHAWEVGSGISSDLWSMPSSHTAFAVVMSVFLVTLYPRLKWFGVGMAVLVGCCRVLFGAHYPADVLVGGGVGWVLASLAVGGFWGVRGLDWVWVRLVNRGAEPAWPRVAADEARRRGQDGAGGI